MTNTATAAILSTPPVVNPRLIASLTAWLDMNPWESDLRADVIFEAALALTHRVQFPSHANMMQWFSVSETLADVFGVSTAVIDMWEAFYGWDFANVDIAA